MRYPEPLAWGTLLRRYQRFLADVRLGSGRVVTVHVPNSGRMTGCSTPGSPCLLLASHNPRRRLAWTLEQVIAGGVSIGVNTARASRLAEEALDTEVARLPGLRSPWSIRREVTVGSSRLDLLLEDGDGAYWVEVKSVTLVSEGVAEFPDAVTARGTRHVEELTARVASGDRAAVLFIVQRSDAGAVRAATPVDPAFATALAVARRAGVEVLAVQVAIGPTALRPWRRLAVVD